MTADIEKLTENELLKRNATALRAVVLVVPHHGSRTSSSDAFIVAVAPKLALIAVGYRSRYRHPNAAVVERYRARGIALFRSDLEGAITIKFPALVGEPPQISRYRRDARRYWTDLARDDAADADTAER